MFYVKTDSDGQLERYPYTLTDLRRDQSSVSLPRDISDETAAGFGVYPVTPADQPADDHTKNLERTAVRSGDVWVEQWTEVDASADEITARTEAKSRDIRVERDERLAACDWTQLADSPLSDSDKTAWATYRQSLRDLPSSDGFPHDVTWPDEPS